MPLSRVAEYTPGAARGHCSAVSLHSHSHHSKEMLTFMPTWADGVPFVGPLVRREMDRYEARHGRPPEFSNAYWVPPFTPEEVLASERAQIASRFGLPAIVSITDHDTIEAGLGLLGTGLADDTVVSVEWTVPYRGTNFHLGVHNLPRDAATTMMGAFEAYRLAPDEARLGELLAWANEQRDMLVVMNHPLWNANGNLDQSSSALSAFVGTYRPFLHAAELNGYRTHAENRQVIALARAWEMPLVGGGDRHGRSPNALINLSQGTTIAEFVDEVRREQRSDTVLLPAYREHRTTRVAETVSDVLRHARPGEPGQQPWLERVFIIYDDGRARPISDQWGDRRCPWWVQACVRAACAYGSISGQLLLRMALRPRRGVLAHSESVAWPVSQSGDESISRSSSSSPLGAVQAMVSED